MCFIYEACCWVLFFDPVFVSVSFDKAVELRLFILRLVTERYLLIPVIALLSVADFYHFGLLPILPGVFIPLYSLTSFCLF